MSVQSIHAFAEKVALVTDGASPIGRAVALQLALQGSFVIIGYSKAEAGARSSIDELISLGTLASAVEADVSEPCGADRLIENIDKTFGRLDLLVNCLKFQTDSSFEQTTEDIFAETVKRNLTSAFFMTQRALRLMEPRPKPRIVNVSFAGESGNIAFDVLQSAVRQLTRSLADDLPGNFRVNGVEVHESKVPAVPEFDVELIRPKQGVSPDDVARTVLYLLSPEAAALNGQIIALR